MDIKSKHSGLPPMNSANQPKRNFSKVYIVVICLLVLSNIFIFNHFKNKNNSSEHLPSINPQSSEILKESNAEINAHYNTALAKLDQLSMQNSTLNQQLNDKSSEISMLKDSIETILKNMNSTKEDYVRAQHMIQKLDAKINYYTSEINKYKKENQKLLKENKQISEKNQQLEEQNEFLTKKVEYQRIFQVNNIKILPIELRRGGSEVETSKARRVDILRIKFDISENNMPEAGTHIFYLRIIDPDGKLIFDTNSGSGMFEINGIDLEQKYTKSRKFHFSNSDPIRNLTIDWEQPNDYPKGQYVIELYHEGELIGKSVRQLR